MQLSFLFSVSCSSPTLESKAQCITFNSSLSLSLPLPSHFASPAKSPTFCLIPHSSLSSITFDCHFYTFVNITRYITLNTLTWQEEQKRHANTYFIIIQYRGKWNIHNKLLTVAIFSFFFPSLLSMFNKQDTFSFAPPIDHWFMQLFRILTLSLSTWNLFKLLHSTVQCLCSRFILSPQMRAFSFPHSQHVPSLLFSLSLCIALALFSHLSSTHKCNKRTSTSFANFVSLTLPSCPLVPIH